MRYTIAMMVVHWPWPMRPAVSVTGAAGAAAREVAKTDNRLTTFAGFTVDYPKKDWQVLGGTGSSVVVFVHKSREATVAIERTKIEHPLAANEIVEQTATLEVEEWQVRRPLSTGFAHQTRRLPGRPFHRHRFLAAGTSGARTRPAVHDASRRRLVPCRLHEPAELPSRRTRTTCHRIALSLTKTAP